MKFGATLFFSYYLLHSLVIGLAVFNVEDDDLRLIKVGPQELRVIKESEKLGLKRREKKFIDMTAQISVKDAIDKGMIGGYQGGFLDNLLRLGAKKIEYLEKPIPDYDYPKEVNFAKEVKSLLREIDTDRMYNDLSNFTSFFTRYYKSENGRKSAEWLELQIKDIIKPISDSGVSVRRFVHAWTQFSIIATIKGKSSSKVIVGCHQDSMNLLFPNLMRAPGADDDGSGTVTVLESLRILVGAVQRGFVPENTLEFHFYSAEEGGLLGSMDVFSNYSKNHETVLAALQQDMTGFTSKTTENGVEPHFGLITDYTSNGLNKFLKLVINNYCDIPFHETECGYACSDHASAIENGYPASFIIESEFKYSNGFIHSVLDTIDRLDWSHIKEHVKLTVAYAYELAAINIST